MYSLQLTSSKVRSKSDILGIFATTLCLAHCVLTPVIFLAQAHMADHHEASPSWWGFIDYLFLAISIIAVHYSAKKTSLKWMPFLLYLSWGLLALYIICEKFHLLHLDHALIYIPALALVGLHLYNRKHCHCNEEECCVDE